MNDQANSGSDSRRLAVIKVGGDILLDEIQRSGLAKNILILAPPSLVYQWQYELESKFSLHFTQKDDSDYKDPASHDLLIFSHSSAVYPTAANFLKKRRI
jgi:SNF2 family DNA or RNA helicase